MPERIFSAALVRTGDARFGEARLKLAESYERTGDLRNAYREYMRAADLMPSDEQAQRAARARRMAWGLAIVVIACYLGFIVMTGIKGPH